MSSKTDTETGGTGAAPAPGVEFERVRHRVLPGGGVALLRIASVGSMAASVYYIFGVGNLLGTYVPLENEYFYVLLMLLLPAAILVFPARAADADHIPWYDVVVVAAALAATLFMLFNSDRIINEGWEYQAPELGIWVAFMLWAIVLEGLRRAGGMPIFMITAIVSVYPVLAEFAPGFLEGMPVRPATTAGYHVYGLESILGLPMTAFAMLVIGFLIFGVALQCTGGGAFFLNFAFALLGRYRGGPAKVAIFASGLMGSMSGSVVTNVLTTGAMTIPAMKKVRFRSSYAGGVEACASTGGVLMPPVMGATAFVMATYLEVPYSEVVIAAVVPSVLYYLGLFLQIDAYAARYELRGIPEQDLPSIREVLREGWYFIVVFVVLIIMLLYMQREAQAPYYATAALLAINQMSAKTRWRGADVLEFVDSVGRLFAELAAVLAGVGLIIGALMLTGKIGSFAYELVDLAGENMLALLGMAALTSFILGIGMTATAAYLFLAVTVGPALINTGLDKLAVHLFLLYWGMVSYITPPVAIGAYAAASIAKSDPFRTGLEAMRLGSIIYFIPFFFVLNPALIGRGDAFEVVVVIATSIAGIASIAAALQGHVFGIGGFSRLPTAVTGRGLLLIGGIALALPGNDIIGVTHIELSVVALVLITAGVAIALIDKNAGTRTLRPPTDAPSSAQAGSSDNMG